jgi:predicted GIY-YIG superfamily endonuclease
MWTVYLLVDPRDGEIRYVGGSKHVHKRYWEHMGGGTPNRAKNSWIQELTHENLRPSLEVLVRCETEREMIESEIAWTHRLRAAGCAIFNASRRRAHSSKHPLWSANVGKDSNPFKNQAAVELGRLGGRAKSPKKAAAARRNWKKAQKIMKARRKAKAAAP